MVRCFPATRTNPPRQKGFSFMLSTRYAIKRACVSLLVSACVLAPPSLLAQQQTTPAATTQDRDEVVRISTELVQTDVTVFDKEGKFVEGLRPEDFELKVDGKPQQIAFFERVMAGTVDEDAQLRAARGGSARVPSQPDAGKVQPLDRGRMVFFFLDDLHLSPGSVARARKILLNYFEQEMGQNDEVAVVSATGQVGFLQQLTTDKTVLRAAVARINHRPYLVTDHERPRMTEAHALAVMQNNPTVLQYFVEQMIEENPRIPPDMAKNLVQMRAGNVVRLSGHISRQTLTALESLVRGSAAAPGRKIVFFISDGFVIDSSNNDTGYQMRRLTDAAARAGVVIYALDGRGLVPSGLTDASSEGNFDVSGQLAGAALDEVPLMQQPLRTLAGDTGGRAILNTNALDRALTKAVKETSVYYLLAWRPEGAEGRGAKFRRIDVDVKGRSNLKVMVRKGFYLTPPDPPAERAAVKKDGKETKEAKGASARPKTPEEELRKALTAAYPQDSLPTSLALAYVNAPNNSMVLSAAIEIDDAFLGYSGEGGGKKALADVAGAVFDDRGKAVSSMRQELSILPPAVANVGRQRITQSYQIMLSPGLYQVRFAVRDRVTGRAGSAMQWVEIPDPRKKGFFLSSLFVAERVPAEQSNQDANADPLLRGVSQTAARRFANTSWLRFVTYVYNASRTDAAPADVVLQVQIFRDDQPVMTTPLRKIGTEGVEDLARIPYAAEVPLDSLPAGRYVLQVTAIDRAAKASASQRVNFSIE